MKTYSPERKAAVIARMMPPHNQSVVQIARSEGIPTNTLYAWRSHAGIIAKRHYFDNSQLCFFATYQGSGCNHF